MSSSNATLSDSRWPLDKKQTGHVVECRELRTDETALPESKPRVNSFPTISSRSSWLSKLMGKGKGNSKDVFWRPVTMRKSVLLIFVLFSAGIIVLLELLAKQSLKSENGGGLVFAKDVESFSTLSSFIFLYLPIIVAVIYSMLWSWVDLDAKRLEPWFQLSKENGANAEDSLLLQYPFDFLPFVPFAALRRQHWAVFCSGTIMLLVFWVVTPLQSAVFNTGVVIRTFPTEFINSAALIPLKTQITNMHANILNRAYGITWLNETLPPYTTHEFATLPFTPSRKTQIMAGAGLSEIWKTRVNAFRTNLTCNAAQLTWSDIDGYTFDNGEGCVWTSPLPDIAPASDPSGLYPATKYLLMYIGWDSDAHVSYSFGNPNCSEKYSNNYLAVFATAKSRVKTGMFNDLQAFFCEPSYHIEEMDVVLNATSQAVLSAKLSGKILDEPVSATFNTTLFEYVMGAGVNPEVYYLRKDERKTNYPDTDRMEQYPRVMELGLKWPLTNMAGFAAGLNSLDLQEFADPEVLRRGFEKAHQVLFTSAFSILTRNLSATSQQIPIRGFREDQKSAIVYVRAIAIAVEVAFGMIILLALALSFSSSHRVTKLAYNPDSIAAVMSVTAVDDPLSQLISDDGTVTSGRLDEALYRKRFKLSKVTNPMPKINSVSNSAMSSSSTKNKQSTEDLTKPFKPIRPLEHRLYFGLVFSGLILVASAALIFIERWSSIKDGITLPSQNPVVQSIIQNYAPTAFATFLEPMWVVFSRLLCLLLPFEVLRSGGARASRSLQLKYTSLPPQLAVWRAIRARDFLLAFVCFTAVSTNVLAVALAGLLNEGLTQVKLPYAALQHLSPTFNNTSIIKITDAPIAMRDHFYVALSQYSTKSQLLPWLDMEKYYLPFTTNSVQITQENSKNQSQTFHSATYGVRSNTTCSVLTPSEIDSTAKDTINYVPNFANSTAKFSTSHLHSDGSRSFCVSRLGGAGVSKDKATVQAQSPGLGASAMEFVEQLAPLGQQSIGRQIPLSEEDEYCNNLLVIGWGRTATVSSNTQKRNVESLFIACHSTAEIARYNVSVDAAGHVLSSNRSGDFVQNDESLYAGVNASAYRLFTSASEAIAFQSGGFSWHNDSFTSDWINSLLIAKSEHADPSSLDASANFTSIVDPSSPLPNGTAIASTMSDMYTFLFAILLSMNAENMFTNAVPASTVAAEVNIQVTKIFVSDSMFKLALIILLIHFCTAVAYYIFRPKRFLTRMPTTIASVMAYVSCSRALDDFPLGSHDEKPIGRDGEEQRYGYGRFLGRDGKTHVGIERMRYVIPLESENPEMKRKGWWSGLRRRRGKGDGGQVKTWI